MKKYYLALAILGLVTPSMVSAVKPAQNAQSIQDQKKAQDLQLLSLHYTASMGLIEQLSVNLRLNRESVAKLIKAVKDKHQAGQMAGNEAFTEITKKMIEIDAATKQISDTLKAQKDSIDQGIKDFGMLPKFEAMESQMKEMQKHLNSIYAQNKSFYKQIEWDRIKEKELAENSQKK